MKKFLVLLYCTLICFFSLHAAPVVMGNFNTATNLLAAGDVSGAYAIFSAIPASDPAYISAKGYEALCQYNMGNYSQFLKLMDSGSISVSQVDPAMAANLSSAEVRALFATRKFELLLPKIESFQAAYPNATQAGEMAEYQKAGLFERGMKKAIEAGNNVDTNQASERWAEAHTNLMAFLSLNTGASGRNYNYLTNRVLREDIWRARIAMGEGSKALAEIPATDILGQEKFSFLQIKLYAEKLHRDQTDLGINLMSDYLKKFPASDDRARVTLDMAEFSYRKGEQLIQEADNADQIGDRQTAEQKRTAADQNFQQMRLYQAQIVTNRAAGIEDSDVLDSREDLLFSYLLQKNYDTVLSMSSAMITASQPGEQSWLMGKLYHGITLESLPTPKSVEAAADLDEIIALGFKNRPDHDKFVLFATKWRIKIAQLAGDRPKAVQLVLGVANSNCKKNLKTGFMKTFGHIAGLE